MHNNDILKLQYNQSSCKDARLFSYGQMTSPSFKAKVPKNAEKQISDETLKLASAAIAASGIVYISGRTKITKEEQEEILARYKNGEGCKTIAKEMGLGKSTVLRFLKLQPNLDNLKESSNAKRKFFTEEQEKDIIERCLNGESTESIAKSYGCSKKPIHNLINSQPNADKIKKQMVKAIVITPELEKNIIEKYRSGISFITIAKELGCAKSTIHNLIRRQPDAKELIAINKQKRALFTSKQKDEIIKRYIDGDSADTISQDYDCSGASILNLINSQSNANEIKEKHENNRFIFSQAQINEIVEMYKEGNTLEIISKKFNCSCSCIQKYIEKQPDADEIIRIGKSNRTFFTAEQQEEIISKYKQGISIERLAAIMNCSPKAINNFIRRQPNAEELKEISKNSRILFTEEQEKEIIEKYSNGATYESLAKEYDCSRGSICNLIDRQPNSKELKKLSKQNRSRQIKRKISEKDRPDIIELYKQGMSFAEIAKRYDYSASNITNLIQEDTNINILNELHQQNSQRFSQEDIINIKERYKKGDRDVNIAMDYNCSKSTIKILISMQRDYEDIILMRKRNMLNKTQEEQQKIIEQYKSGTSIEVLAKQFDCTNGYVKYLIYSQPNIEELKLEHKNNMTKFNEQIVQEILKRILINGEHIGRVAKDLKCSTAQVWNIIKLEQLKNIEGSTRETFLHKYNKYTIDELKTRLSEFLNCNEIENNEDLLELMYYFDEKSNYNKDEKFLLIAFIRLLDKFESNKITNIKVNNSPSIAKVYAFMDREIAKNQAYEELTYEYKKIIDNFSASKSDELADICLKYVAHDINDEDKISSMKDILNIIATNNDTEIRHKLAAYDTIKQNPDDAVLKEAQKLYGEDNQEKIGQYIIFDQALKGEYTNADFDNDALAFIDVLKGMHLNNDAIIKRLIELEDYFNSEEGKNNSLTNFIKCFNSNDNYINKLLTDFYIDNIYKDKVTTIEVVPDSKYFSGKNITLMIYPEAKQATLGNTEVNIDKHLFLIDTEEYAHNFASRKFSSLGVKIFTLDKSYQKEGFYSGENVLEIKVPNGHKGARLAAKIKNEDDIVFEIRYFMPKGFHREKKRTDL